MIYVADPRTFDDALLQRLLPLLPPEKQASIEKIVHFPTKRQAIAAWALLVYALRTRGQDLPPLRFSETGKPAFQNGTLHFNLSHTDTLVCAAVADSPVGVDVQSPAAPSDGVIRRMLSREEQDLLARTDDKTALFTRFWTQKEAYAKWTGEGLSCGFSSRSFAPYAQAESFSAFGTQFRVWQFPDAVLTVCCETQMHQTLCVTPQMLESTLFCAANG